MFSMDCAAPDIDRGAADLVNSQNIEGNAGGNDVADGIHGADLVEMDSFEKAASGRL